MWKIVTVIILGLAGWVGLALALTPEPDASPTPRWVDMTPTHAFFQSTTTADMINEILTRAIYWSGPNWQEPTNQAVYEASYTTSETPEQVLTAFFNAFTTGDWQHISKIDESRSGFTGPVPFTTQFCYLQGHGTLRLSIEEPTVDMTDVSIYVNFPSREYTCGDINPAVSTGLPSLNPLPLLVAPSGVVIVSHAQSDVANGVIHDAHEDGLLFRSPLPLPDIVAAYHAQLVGAGWQLVLEDVTSSAAMSAWTVVDDEGAVWTGMLVFTSDSEPEHYRVYIAMEPRP